ncbi:MAG: UDP-N-acetylmuramoyl-tripeptide--D-alanyl-D-alanine ligase [candidate division Zixibacteria bacterium]|nr:UDP-N-acetylmuramoyl-tripeptide--D-alanyl-D-alanine ligase [candidate division Zixibacteria bacterium]
MDPMSVSEIIEIAKPLYGFTLCDTSVKGVSIDSRTLKRGDLFVAVKGKRTDGHLYIQEALEKGAVGIVAESPHSIRDVNSTQGQDNFFIVKNSLTFLGDLARAYLKKLGTRVICVTGTNGKTTVKEFLVRLLSEDYFTTGSKGNLNNLYGLPLSIFEASCWSEAAVFEIGMSELGEIARLCEIAQPQIGVLTNIGPAHLENLGNLKNVVKAKAEMLEFLGSRQRTAVVNLDDNNIANIIKKFDCDYATVGMSESADFRITDIEFDNMGNGIFKLNGYPVELKIPGMHNIYNTSIAAATAVTFGMNFQDVIGLLPYLKTPEMRSSVEVINGITLIDDAYNANPQSTQNAVRMLNSIDANKRYMVFGDMLELGDQSVGFHKEVGKRIAEADIDRLITIGELAEYTGKAAGKYNRSMVVTHLKEHREIAGLLFEELSEGDAVLFKGSRGIELEKVIEYLKEELKG